MTEEERRLARQENNSLARFLRAFALSSVYGAICFFAFWKIKDAVPALAAALLPDLPQSSPYRLIVAATACIAGIAWFSSYIALLLVLDRTEGMRHILKKLALWCAIAGLVWLAGDLLIRLALQLA